MVDKIGKVSYRLSMNEYQQTVKYLTETRKVHGRKAWTFLARNTGNDRSWFPKFVKGEIPNPRYFQIRGILDFAESQGWRCE